MSAFSTCSLITQTASYSEIKCTRPAMMDNIHNVVGGEVVSAYQTQDLIILKGVFKSQKGH